MEKKELIHQRNISVNCYEGEDGNLIVEGTLSDERLFASLIYSANQKRPPGFVHTMKVAMKLSIPKLEIVDIVVDMPVVPMEECAETARVVKRLVGRRITGGFTNEVRQLIGKTNGCLHTTNLIIAMASASIQGAWSYYSRVRDDGSVRIPQNDESAVINSCWMWREDGPLVKRFRAAKQKMAFVVAIDGPAGSGKSTVSKELARRLGFVYLDTGALYRALAFKVIRAGVKEEDMQAIEKICETTNITFNGVGLSARVLLDGEDVSSEIRGEEVGMVASRLSALPVVRMSLLETQRRIGRDNNGLVAEGRDTGSVVFPDAPVKIFLVADVKERANRRHKELLEKG